MMLTKSEDKWISEFVASLEKHVIEKAISF